MNGQQPAEIPRLQVFACTSGRKIDKHLFIYVEADRWFDARQFAFSIYGDSPFKMENATGKRELHAKARHIHRGNWWRVTYTGNAANNTLEKVVTRYNADGKPIPWAS